MGGPERVLSARESSKSIEAYWWLRVATEENDDVHRIVPAVLYPPDDPVKPDPEAQARVEKMVEKGRQLVRRRECHRAFWKLGGGLVAAIGGGRVRFKIGGTVGGSYTR